MASGVFGVPISEETVRATGEYKEPITQKDIADYAMKMINAGGKDTNAQTFVDNLKDRYGNGISTKCLIYNATGTTLNFVTYNDWHGHIYETPYPSVIQNGQWGAYLHVHPSAAMVGSAGAVVYRSKVPSSNDSCDWLFSWSIPYIGDDRIYTEIREEGHFPPHWDYIYHVKLENSGRNSTDSGYGYVSNTEIGEGTTVNARAIFHLPY
ncbi:hypothetical protein QOZ80_9AG0671690 [Eleusine coracana subsp. coracana]|nr:hypothetical protein QOZ80_9AG0671690 [Eleusine coracana subsp. coracana]